ncbi:Cytochrome P450 [Melia azedarach]|uniref:Cytochrome P450 n=1 Tax=Melia azedarach TaxID=155640 RepID=A0ACC1YP07_MELAZ|nr:Cytochrome P450 [Melia azedarach]
MKMEITNWCIAFGTIIIVVAWKILNWVWFKPKRLEKFFRQQGFSGNSYTLLHGDIKEITKGAKEANSKPIGIYDDIMPRVFHYHLHIINKYGKNSFEWFGPNPCLNITEPKLISEVLLKHEIFKKPRRNPISKYLVQGMVMYEGEKWSKVRKIANPAFYFEKLKDLLPEMHTSCKDMVNKWKDLLSNKESVEIDVWADIQVMTADVISRTAFGSSFEDGKKIFELITKQIDNMIDVLKMPYIPGWRFLPTPTNRKLIGNYKEIRKLIQGIINKREEALKMGKARNDDLLGLLMESNRNEIQENKAGMSIDEVIEECKQFYIAGQESSAVLLTWTMIFLSIHPNWQERAREEVLRIFGNKEPKFEGMNQLKVVGSILYEVLRFFPPASMLTRITSKETKLGEFVIPAGVLVQLPLGVVHQDPEYWGDGAKEFNPDRFSEGVSKACKKQLAYFAFGGGPRICIGQNFALMEAKLSLALILQNFSFQLSPTYVHAPIKRLSIIHPQYGAPLVFHKISM